MLQVLLNVELWWLLCVWFSISSFRRDFTVTCQHLIILLPILPTHGCLPFLIEAARWWCVCLMDISKNFGNYQLYYLLAQRLWRKGMTCTTLAFMQVISSASDGDSSPTTIGRRQTASRSGERCCIKQKNVWWKCVLAGRRCAGPFEDIARHVTLYW